MLGGIPLAGSDTCGVVMVVMCMVFVWLHLFYGFHVVSSFLWVWISLMVLCVFTQLYTGMVMDSDYIPSVILLGMSVTGYVGCCYGIDQAFGLWWCSRCEVSI